MFTGIITEIATLQSVEAQGSNRTFTLACNGNMDFGVDDSIAHNGVCLTVETIQDSRYTVTAIAETLQKTTMATWKVGLKVNLEQAMQLGDRLDGHLVQGHVDGVGQCMGRKDMAGSTLFTFAYERKFMPLIIEKGSICIDGISLTAFQLSENQFSVAIIPYTIEHTNLRHLQAGMLVNLEFDLLGKYLARARSLEL